MNVAFEAAALAMGATVMEAEKAPRTLRVVTDTRAIAVGDTFLALRGERFDGHDYVREAIAKGAAAVIIDDASARIAGTTTLVVARGLAAYMTVASLARDSFRGSVVAITGSAGKTTTKALLAQLLAARYGERVLASPANENNEIGVSHLLLRASNELHDVVVVEMGARHFNDIAPLVAIAKPHVGVLTNIGDAHVEIMGSRDRLAQTKWALFDGGARAVLNAGDLISQARADSLAELPHWFGTEDDIAPRLHPNARSTSIIGRTCLVDRRGDLADERAIDVRIPGQHNRANLAAAVATALELGVDLDRMVAGIPSLSLPGGRFESTVLPNQARIIYDAYNANTAGMLAALEALSEEVGDRRLAVLASMAELGEEAASAHGRVGERAAAIKLDWLLVGGDFADHMAKGAIDAGLSSERIVHFATNDEAIRWLRENLRARDTALLKGSRKYRLEEILRELLR